MKTITELIESLMLILQTDRKKRIELIKEFQNKIWEDQSVENKQLNEILSELTYDLDFYEPNEKWRKESVSYFGDEKLEEILKSAILKLQKENNSKFLS